jgi:hypothetical protein
LWCLNDLANERGLARFQGDADLAESHFLAAGKSCLAGNRDRLPALRLSLAEWLNEASDKFKLIDEIEDVLEHETRRIKTTAHSIRAMLEEPNQARKDLAAKGIDFNKIKKELEMRKTDGFLFIQDEYRSVWNPGSFPTEVPYRPRKLIPKSRYWFKQFKGSLAALEQTGCSHPELNKYLKDIAKERILIPEFKTGGKS